MLSFKSNLENIIFSFNFIMTNFTKNNNGKYIVSGKTYEELIGTRAQVWHDNAFKTSGGLIKKNLLKNKAGRIVSRSKHDSAKKDQRLLKAGYGTKKGKFGFVKVKKSKTARSSKKSHRGGSGVNSSLNPASIKGIKGDISNLNLMVTNY